MITQVTKNQIKALNQMVAFNEGKYGVSKPSGLIVRILCDRGYANKNRLQWSGYELTTLGWSVRDHYRLYDELPWTDGCVIVEKPVKKDPNACEAGYMRCKSCGVDREIGELKCYVCMAIEEAKTENEIEAMYS